MTDDRIRASEEDDGDVQLYLRTNHVSAHATGISELELEVCVFIEERDIDPLIAALQRISDDQTARAYADSEVAP